MLDMRVVRVIHSLHSTSRSSCRHIMHLIVARFCITSLQMPVVYVVPRSTVQRDSTIELCCRNVYKHYNWHSVIACEAHQSTACRQNFGTTIEPHQSLATPHMKRNPSATTQTSRLQHNQNRRRILISLRLVVCQYFSIFASYPST